MRLKDLLELPVGAHVFGEINAVTAVPGVVESFKDGSRFIRWADGYVTIPFGRVRDYDEFIAAHTQLASPRCDSGAAGANQGNKRRRMYESAEQCLERDEHAAEEAYG